MKKNKFTALEKLIQICLIFCFLIIVLLSCAGQRNRNFIPEPDFSVYKIENKIDFGDIVETKNRPASNRNYPPEESLPLWLYVFINEGIKETEKIENFNEKYVFISYQSGVNFSALLKWSDNFSAQQDFSKLSAIRIEERLIAGASLFPDDEYGKFFERLVKRAYNTEYNGVVKEETFWFKSSSPDLYHFYILFTIDKSVMKMIIEDMMAKSIGNERLTKAQTASVSKIRQSFFEGY